MTARILPFPDFFRPASPRDEMGALLILESRAKEPEANARSAVTTSGRLAMGSSRPVTGRSVTATSERTDVTAGETALNSVPHATPACAMGAGRDCNGAVSGATGGESAALISPRECPKVQELRRQSKRLREYFKRQDVEP